MTSDTVYLVVSENWDDTQIHGAYGSLEAALLAHPAPQGQQWAPDGDGGYYLEPVPYGQSWEIRPFEVKV